MSDSTGCDGPSSLPDLEALPKAELHLHLRGAIPIPFLREQFRKYPPKRAISTAPPSQVQFMRQHPGVNRIVESEDPASEVECLFRKASFDEFLGAYLFTSCFVRELEDFERLVEGVRQELQKQNIAYAEITVSVPEYIQQGIEFEDLMGVLAEDPPGLPKVRWIVDAVRNYGPDAALAMLERLQSFLPPTVIGLTLGGAEHKQPAARFGEVYALARTCGLRTTVHAGEALGPESVWDSVRILGVERIGHGVRAIEDPALVAYLAERSIPLEVCPTSNVCTGVYPSLEAHPVRKLCDAGVQVSINTDDPTFFGVSLAQELANLRRLDFSWTEIGDLAANAFQMAFDPVAANLAAQEARSGISSCPHRSDA